MKKVCKTNGITKKRNGILPLRFFVYLSPPTFAGWKFRHDGLHLKKETQGAGKEIAGRTLIFFPGTLSEKSPMQLRPQ